MATYQQFLDALSQLEQDQSLFEAEVGNAELSGAQHEDIIKLGGQMLKKFKKFSEKGQSFAESLPPDFLAKLIDSIESYQNLIMPPKIFGGMCPCLKPARSGVDYEKKFNLAKSKMVSSYFLSQAVVIESDAEKRNMDSMHFSDYINRMNNIHNSIAEIKCSGGEKSLEAARKKLLTAIASIEKFLTIFEENFEKTDFKVEANRRIKSTQELLSSRQSSSDGSSMPISKRVLVKAKSSLQEVMNSAAGISFGLSKENLTELEKLSAQLKKVRDYELNIFNELENFMSNNNLIDTLHRLREDSEITFSDANSKLRDSTKRWTTIKAQSVPRKVAEYEEENENRGNGVMTSNIPAPDINPQKLIKQTSKQLGNVGGQVGKLAFGVVNVVNSAASEVGSLASQSASGAKNMATNSVNSAKQVSSKAVKSAKNQIDSAKSQLGLEEPPPPQKSTKTGLAKYNPLDAIDGMLDEIKPPSKAKLGMGMFNALDSF